MLSGSYYLVCIHDGIVFYGTFFASISIPPKIKEYKLSELRGLIEEHLRFVCVEQDNIFEALLCICTNCEKGFTEYNDRGNSQLTKIDNILALIFEGIS
jgi:hypothetical protein